AARSPTASCSWRRSSRFRPATTRACSRRSSRAFSRPASAKRPRTLPRARAPPPRRPPRSSRRRRSVSAHRRRTRGGGHGDGGHASDERWLLTYSDMITLLMALFIIMWAISMVNKTKFDELRVSLREAFTHQKVLDGQTSVFENQGSSEQTPLAIVPRDPASSVVRQISRIQAQQEQQNLRHLQELLRQYAATHGLTGELRTAIDERGLVIRLLTDKLLFGSGSAVLP